MGVLLSVET